MQHWPWIDSGELKSQLGISKFVGARLRSQLPSPIYWCKPEGGRKILWNHRLVRDWLLNGGNSPDHQRLIEEYVRSTQQVA